MKKNRTRIFSLVVAVMMLASLLAVPALAADEGSITINKSVSGKVYDVYRVFDLEYTEDAQGSKLYTYSINSDFAAFFADEYSVTDDAEAVAIVSAMTDDSVELNAFAEKVKAYVLENGVSAAATVTATSDTTVIDGLPLGYYLVYPQGGLTAVCSLTTTDPDGEVNVKTDYPEIEKSIVEGDLRLDNTTGKVGDVVVFELKSKVPDMVGYTKYSYTVTDVLSAGLTFNDDVAITVGGTTINTPADYTVNGTSTITIDFVDFLGKYSDMAGADIIITYSATINENAVVGGDGNPNTVDLTYSNNPGDSTSTDTTPKDEVIVYTFRLDVLKVDAADHEKTLDGAIFSLWTEQEITGAETKQYTGSDDVEKTLYLYAGNLETSGGVFNCSVKAGTYYLFEDKAPDGYNQMTDPIIFTVTPVIDSQTNKLTALTIDNTSLTSEGNTGVIDTTIENRSGLLLPSTGGIGTHIFLVAGALIMLAAAMGFFIHKKRASKSQGSNNA